MANITDLRQVDRLTHTLVLPGDGEVVVHLCAPTVELVNELKEGSDALFAVLRGDEGSDAAKRAVYDFAARLINCNVDDFTTTAQELAVKYRLSLNALGVFFVDYVDFLDQIQNGKN